MENNRVEVFLDLYKQLEQLLKQVYGNDAGRFDSVVVRYENSPECGSWKDELHAIRDIRNLLQHNPKIYGSYIVEPSEEVLKALQEIILQVVHPRLAIEFGVPDNKIYKATLNSGLRKILKVMKERGFSQVPVIENNMLYGVISAYAVFEFVTEMGMEIITDVTKVRDMKDYLPPSKHRNEYYLFMPKTATFVDADEAFEKRDSKGRRLVAIFITETGSPKEQILSMLTPWSVVGK